MRSFENHLISDTELNKRAIEDIEVYENAMLHNIYSYSSNNKFDTAIFMCGVAHRKSIIEKVIEFNAQKELNLNWVKVEK